jgi:hypothetical protein
VGSIKREANNEAYPADDTLVEVRILGKAFTAPCGITVGTNTSLGQSEVVQEVVMDAQLLGSCCALKK